MRRSALVCLVDEGHVLLAQNADGKGMGLWAPYGGGIKKGETAKDAAVRETYEESLIRVRKKDLTHAATITIYRRGVIDLRLSVFTCRLWRGTPVDTSEMHNARRFAYSRLPLGRMRNADREWLPRVLAGEKFRADVHLATHGSQHKKIEYRTLDTSPPA